MKTTKLPSVFSNRDSFINSFDSVFDTLMANTYPSFTENFGMDFFTKTAYPKVNIVDYDDRMQIVAEIAGLDKSEIDIEVKDNTLSISGGKKYDHTETSGRLIHSELKHSKFRRSFLVDPERFELDDVDATFDNGLLNITLTKRVKQENRTKKISIK